MSDSEQKKILASVEVSDFIGRERELETILQHAAGEDNSVAGMFVLSAPAEGLSELLKQVYDRLFYEQGGQIPVYFEFKKSDKTFKQTAVRFLQTFINQTVAFSRNNAEIIDSSPDVCEISELSTPANGGWIEKLIKACTRESELNNESAFVRQAFSATLRANANNTRVFVMFDNLEAVENLTGDTDFIEELKAIFKRSNVPFVFAGMRRFVLKAMLSGNTKLNEAEILSLNSLSAENGGFLVEHLTNKKAIKITDQTRDLIVHQFNSSPVHIKNIINAASDKNSNLDTFQAVEQIYTEELFGGKIKAHFDTVFNEISNKSEVQKQFISLLYNALTVEKERVPIESWRKHTALNETEFYRAMNLLDAYEILSVSSNMLEASRENNVLSDYITKRFRLEIRNDKRALAIAETLSEFLKQAPLTMAKYYRRKTAVGLRELLTVFDCQQVPVSLLFYNVFKELHKGKNTDEILEDVKNNDAEKVELPQIVYTANTVAFYPRISRLTEKERSAVAFGFEAGDYRDENETVWIAAEVDSKLEADAETTRFWCDRLEMVGLMCDFPKFRLWLVSPEGFSPEASEVLSRRNAVGSSRRQFELLAKYLDAENLIDERSNENEFEMVIPMGDDTELIAAYAVEELARRHSFDAKAINQIKTALVEACINATEHSHSPDRKIYQKFNIEDDKITITISNRGLRFNGEKVKEFTPHEGRRGWGLKLMNSLMDEVKFEQVDDGTKISLVKYMAKA